MNDLGEVQQLFFEDLISTLQVIALDAKIQVNFTRELVDNYNSISYENRDVVDICGEAIAWTSEAMPAAVS